METKNLLQVGSKHNSLMMLVILLSLVGAALAAVSLYDHTKLASGFQVQPSFCNLGAAVNCDAINASEWSVWWGVPLAGYGLAFYLVVFGFFGAVLLFRRALYQTAMDILLVFGLGSVVFSLYLFYISEFIIGTLCILCAGMYVVNLSYLLLGLIADRRTPLLQRIASGAAALVMFPARVWSSNRSARLDARLGVISGMVLLAAIYILPEYLFMPRIRREYTEFKARLAEEAFESWRRAGVREVPLKLGVGQGSDFFSGSLTAPIVIVEYADFECRACRRFYRVLQDLLAEYSGKYLYVYKNYPLDQSCNPHIAHEYHRSACYAANFALCAGEQGRYWEAVEYLFRMEAFDSEAPVDLVRGQIEQGIARLNVDREAMHHCLQSEHNMVKVAAEIEEAEMLGISGTPFLLVNGRVLPGHDPVVMRRVFDSILAEK